MKSSKGIEKKKNDLEVILQRSRKTQETSWLTCLAFGNQYRRVDSKVDAQHPFGPGPVKTLEKFLEIADRDGCTSFKNLDNYMGHIW